MRAFLITAAKKYAQSVSEAYVSQHSRRNVYVGGSRPSTRLIVEEREGRRGE
jgi:hypothetical protein